MKVSAVLVCAAAGVAAIVAGVFLLAGAGWALIAFGLVMLGFGFLLYEPPNTGGKTL